MSWVDTFFFQWPRPDWINNIHEYELDFKTFPLPRKLWILGRSVDNNRPLRSDRIQVLWLALNYKGKYVPKYVAKIFPEFTEDKAEAQRRRIYTERPAEILQDELDPYMNEARAFQRIERSCESSQRIYFPKFHGVITDLDRSKFTHGCPNCRAIVIEVIKPKLSSRRILAASEKYGCEFRTRLNGLGTLSDFEKEYYTALLVDRTKRLLALHHLGITHGDLRDEHFRLPNDYHDTVLYDFSRSYTFSPDLPYLVNLNPPRSLMEISKSEQGLVEQLVFNRAKKLDFRNYLVKSTGASELVIMAALSQTLQEEQLELIILRVKTQPDNFSMPSVNSVFPFLENIRPVDDLTWHIRRGRRLPFYVPIWVLSAKNRQNQEELVFVTERHPGHAYSGEEIGSYLLCLVPREWGVEYVSSQLLKVCSSLRQGVSGCIKTRSDFNNNI